MEISVIDIFRIVLKRITIVIIVTVLAVAIMLSYCLLFANEVYSAEATVLIASGVLFKDDGEQSNAEYITTGELSTSLALMKSFSGILTRSVEYYENALEVAEEEGLNGTYTADQLMRSTKITYDEDSIFLTLEVKVGDSEDAVTLIGALAQCAPETITSRLGRTSAMVLNADTSATKDSPNTAMMCIAAFVGGLFVSIATVIIIEKLDRTVKGEDDFTKQHDIPLLGAVPDFEGKNKRRIVD